MVKATAYAFPWDFLGDEESAPRVAALGADVVALAATYHSARVPTPLSGTHRVIDVPRSAMYLPVRVGTWRGHRLVPSAPDWLDEKDSFNVAQRRLAEEGLEVDAWIVLTHHDELGYANPDLVVRNAFGEPYPYALCPSHPDVREYCSTLVDETLKLTECRGVVLEACGPMGVEHGGVHDKLEFANFTEADEELLSLCFCEGCRVGLGALNVDADELARHVRERVGTGAPSLEEALGEELSSRVAGYRATLTSDLRGELIEHVTAIKPEARVTVHTSARRWATGSFPALGDPALLQGVSSVVANCWSPSTADAELHSLSDAVSKHIAVGAYLRLDRGWSNEALVTATLRRYVAYGLDELHLYHVGMLSEHGLTMAGGVIDEWRRDAT
jgi:hypothetical protein